MISVCLATYNGERFIQRQLVSILSQLNDEDEIIISDDGSTDKTLEIIEKINSPLIRIYKNEGKQGYTSNFENALLHANGEYIFLSDQDDEWEANKVSVCLEGLQYADFIVSDAVIVDELNNMIAPSFYAERLPKRSLFGNIVKFGYLGCCMAFRQKVLTKALPFPQNRLLCTHDNWLFLVAKTFFKGKISNKKLIKYRRHDQNVSSGAKNTKRSWIFRIHYRGYILGQLFYRIISKK